MASNNLATSTMEHSDSILESDEPERGDVDTTRQGSHYSRGSLPATPDLKRRTKSLSLQDKQWDNLFVSSSSSGKKKHARRKTQDDIWDGFSMEQAQAVARAKLEAAQPSLNRKRRRGGKEDIFRSKKPGAFVRSDSRNSLNPVHRFLSNHPAIMNSLCFASPVKDSRSHEPTEVPLHKDSMQSEAISTADDTVTSTVYYETTRLAGLQQKNPPMPLFDSFQVEDKDGEEIHRIIATHSHSSQRLREMFRQQDWKVDLSDDEDEEDDEDQVMQEDDIPPPMIHSSSESSRSSNGQRV
jgi:hypothetical protein